MERVAAQQPEFTEAVRFTVPPGGFAREWDCRIRHTLSVPVTGNDWLVAVFWVRVIEAGSDGAALKLSMERNAPDYQKSVSAGFTVAGEWRRVQIPFRVIENYQPGGAMIDFWAGYEASQVVEIGGFTLTNHGPSATAPVPATGFTYAGREPDAAWRIAALERIEKHRKADLSVKVVDAGGKPIEGATVKVRMKRHAFGFGSAVAASGILGTRPDDEIYRTKIKELFNKVAIENDLKWPGWEQDRARALNVLRWLRENGIPDIRGHNIVWPGWQYLPRDLQNLTGDPAALRQRIDSHVLEIAGATRGLVTDWDVVNEPIPNRVIQDVLGDYELVRWFQLTRYADPDARLFVNEFGIETGGGRNSAKQRQYLDLIQALLDRNTPLGGIGIQGHFGTDATHPQKVFDIIDKFARFNLPIQITEFDMNTLDEELQADYTRDYMTVCFSHPSIDAFLIWGFWEGRHWLPQAAPYRRDWTEKPNGKVWRDLIFGEWWTNADGATSSDGTYSIRAFLGDHEIEVIVAGGSVRRTVTLKANGAAITIAP